MSKDDAFWDAPAGALKFVISKTILVRQTLYESRPGGECEKVGTWLIEVDNPFKPRKKAS